MRRLALASVLLVLLLPSIADAAACSPLDCAPSQFTLAHGTLLATRSETTGPIRVIDLRTGATRWRLPAGVVDGRVLVSRSGSVLNWYDLTTGRRTRQTSVPRTAGYTLVGGSQDGRRAVLAHTGRLDTTFLVAGAGAARRIVLTGPYFRFDALSGTRLFLIQTLPSGYAVRLFDLAANRLRTRPLKDPGGSPVLWGIPFTRLASPDGRYLFTLYVAPDGGAMIHELDVRNGTARCVDLAGDGDVGAAMTYALALAPDGKTLWAVSPGYGRAVAIDVRSHRVTALIRFRAGDWAANPGTATFAQGGGRIAVTDAQHLWLVEPRLRRVVRGTPHVAIALGWAPGGQSLWEVGERSRVSAVAAT